MIVPVTQPDPNEVLSLASAKLFLVDIPEAEDEEVLAAIADAVKYIEERTGRALAVRTYDLVLDEFPTRIILPHPPLSSVTSVKYIDSSDIEQTLTVDVDYKVYGQGVTGLNTLDCYGGFIEPVDSWPSDLKEDTREIVTVRFIAGYTTPNVIPSVITRCAKDYLGYFYSYKGDTMDRNVLDEINRLLDPYVVYKFV